MSQLEVAEGQRTFQNRTERIVLLVLAAVQFTSIVDFMVVMPLGPQLMRALKIGPTEFGLIVSAYTFAAGAAGLVASSIIDRFARRTAFLTLYAGFLIGTLLCAFAPSYGFLLAARVATGAFGGILGGMSMAIIGDVFPEERRGRATGSLMSGFAVATVVGVPAGLYVGTRFGWHVPFLCLVVLGAPILVISALALPRVDGHLGKAHAHPLRSLIDTFSVPNHLNAFALIISLMIGTFAVVPFVSDYLVANVGVPETELPFVFIAGGGLTLIAAPWIGRVADRRGKLFVYRAIVPISAIMLVVVTHLPPVGTAVAVAVVSTLMVSNAGRMIAAMAMITGSVQRHRRGSFMSANAAVQHFATGIGASFGGLLITKLPDLRLQHYGRVGWIAAAVTLASLWFAGRVRVAEDEPTMTDASSLAAAAEATFDVGEPLVEM
jgi:MFS transporter, DHA1 family, inner membrane transport protein